MEDVQVGVVVPQPPSDRQLDLTLPCGTVVISGGNAQGKTSLLEALYILATTRETIVRFITPGLREGVQVIQETRGNEVGVMGAARLVFEHLDEQSPSA